MAASDELTLTFLRGSGYLHSLIGAWDLLADASSPGPAHKGFLIFVDTTLIAVIERNAERRRGIEGTYSVEGDRIVLTDLKVDTAPAHGPLDDMAFTLAGDLLTITWLAPGSAQPTQVDTFRRRPQAGPNAVLPPAAIYASRESSGNGEPVR
ncbi:MAG: hypothetical protein AB7N91_02390 [Candidatus Tectimicrobiota bacterium]